MALVNAYTSVTALKTRLGDIPDTADDDVLEQVINAASRTVDGLTGTTFYPSTETRYPTAFSVGLVIVPDLLTVTTVKTDEDMDGVYETTISADAYDHVAPGQPLAALRILPSATSTSYFPLTRRAVEVTGTWGGASTTPPEVEEATLILAQRYFMLKNAPTGLIGTTSEFGTRQVALPAELSDVNRLLSAYMGGTVIV